MRVEKIQLVEGIPVCFKISLDHMKPPAKISFNYFNAGQLNVFASFKNIEPTYHQNDFSFV